MKSIFKYFNTIPATVNMDNITSQRTENEQDTDNGETTTQPSTKYGCTCTCCHQKNITQRNYVIFIKKNYNFDNNKIADALSNRYHECNNKEFICKSCHKKLKEGKYDLEQSHQAQLNTHQSNICTQPSPHSNSLNLTQNPKLTNKCMCTCCHRCDIV